MEKRPKKKASPLLGVHGDRAVYLLFNGILKDKSDVGGNVLNTRSLKHLPQHAGPKTIYGARCRFDKARLVTLGLTFKQLPYDLRGKSWS